MSIILLGAGRLLKELEKFLGESNQSYKKQYNFIERKSVTIKATPKRKNEYKISNKQNNGILQKKWYTKNE